MAKSVIHPTAIVGKECELGDGVEIGPYCIVSGHVKLGAGVRLLGNVHVSGQVDIGEGTRIFPFATIGLVPQDLKWKEGGPTAGVKIGKNCVIREHATVHQASIAERPTTIGDKSFLMVGTHMAHDSKIGNSVILVNNVLLAGHAEVGDNVTMGGGSALHEFNRIGRLASHFWGWWVCRWISRRSAWLGPGTRSTG